MKCPKCSNMETRVVDSRVIEAWTWIRRRRECEYCQNRFTTFERTWITDLIVIKRDWTTEIYDRLKIKKALMLSFAKRNISSEKMEEIISNLEITWSWIGKEINSKQIWEDILKILKEIDIIAYVRFASVYMNFESIKDFENILEN